MVEGSANNIKKELEDVISDIKLRRMSLIKAITLDADKLFRLCDPSKRGVGLIGFSDGITWTPKVKPPASKVFSDLPEPTFGINFVRDRMQRDEWLSLVADYSDAWLLSLTSFKANKHRFDAPDRVSLYTRIANLPTLSTEIRTWEAHREQGKKKSPASSQSHTAKPRRKRGRSKDEPQPSKAIISEPKEDEAAGVEDQKEEEEDQDKVCTECGQKEWWVSCSKCGSWTHGNCANISSSSELVKKKDNYACLSCTKPPKKRKFRSS